jgi:hypothetical protein
MCPVLSLALRPCWSLGAILALISLLVVSATAQAQQAIDFNFTYAIFSSAGFFEQGGTIDFLAHPAQGSLTFTLNPAHNCLGSVNVSVPISNITVIENGGPVLHGGTGNFGFSGFGPVTPQCSLFFDDPVAFSNSTGTVNVHGGFDFEVPNWPAALNSHDPLAEILQGSSFSAGGDGMSCTLPGLGTFSATGQCAARGGALPAAVPEPDSALLFGLGLIVLAMTLYRRKASAHIVETTGTAVPEPGTFGLMAL